MSIRSFLPLILFIAGVLIGAFVTWLNMDARLELQVAEQLSESQKAVMAHIEQEKRIAAEKDKRYNLVREMEVLKDSRAEIADEEATRVRIEYVTKDTNARDCGFSDAGVRSWNSSASGGTVPETESARPFNYGGPITARNSEIIEAAQLSFKRHWAAIRQVEKLRNYINEECVK